MSTEFQKYLNNRDEVILRLNAIGLSQALIAQILECSTATVSQRIKALGAETNDTRRAFVDMLFISLSDEMKDWLYNREDNSSLLDLLKSSLELLYRKESQDNGMD